MDVGVQYLALKILYVKFPDQLLIDEHSTHNIEQFGG